jgi:hypothetical protein
MRLSKPTRVCKCWLCIADLYQGHGPTAEEAILDIEWWRDRHLKGMAEADIPKIDNDDFAKLKGAKK